MSESPAAPRDIVADFYNAISNADVDTIVRTIDTHFAEDAAIEWPPSLPHGGRVQGSRKLRAVFSATANPDAPAGAKNLKLVRAIGDESEVAAWITFDWVNPGDETGTANQALELWSFADGKVREIRAFYWNTDAIGAPQRA